MGNALEDLHDKLLAEKPDGAVHDQATCPVCTLTALTAQATTTPEGTSVTTFTQEELDAKIAEATDALSSDMQARIDALEAAAQETEVGKAVAEAVAPKDVEIAELQTKLDETIIEKAAAEKAVEDLRAEVAAELAATALEAKKVDRVAALKALEGEPFDDEYLTANADRFAAESDEDWAARLADYEKLGAKASAGASGSGIPSQTAMTAAREGESTNEGSALSALPMLRRGGQLGDPRTL